MAAEGSAHRVEEVSAIELDEINERTRVEDAGSAHQRDGVVEAGLTGGAPSSFRNLRKWWSHNVCPTITHDPTTDPSLRNRDARDYLALERTYLAHIRTANTLTSFGVLLLQLFRLKEVNSGVGLALGASTASAGMIMVLIGAYRFFFQQRNMLRGEVVVSGPSSWLDWPIIMGVVVAVLAVVLVHD
ncbi:MAG: hypothetical protein LQ350_002908 [Teloschistes chrysophthalmus]|nr:MAG: hypothetical protein LQ350_002908 [Niorma chrysophthalma]